MPESVLLRIAWGLLLVAAALYGGAAASGLSTGRSSREARQPRPMTPEGALALAAFLVGLAGVVFVLEPLDGRHGDAASVLASWRARLPLTALAAGAGGVLSGLLGAAGPWRWAVRFAWPTAAPAAFALVAYRWIARMVPAADRAGADDLLAHAQPFLVLLVLFPLASFSAALVGAVAGRATRRT